MGAGKSCKGALWRSTRGLRLLSHHRQKPAHLTSVALDHRGELGALRHHHADALDHDIIDLEDAAVGDEAPVDLDRRVAAWADHIGRDDDPAHLGSTATDLEPLAVKAGKSGAVDKHHVVLEQPQKFLLLVL